MKAMLYSEVEFGKPEIDDAILNHMMVAQQKLDGARLLTHLGPRPDGGPIFRQRNGGPMKFAAAALHLKAIHEELQDLLGVLDTPLILDGEIIPGTGVYWVFDLFHEQGGYQKYSDRLSALHHLGLDGERVRTIPTYSTLAEKAMLMRDVQRMGGEGVVFKHVRSPYRPGQRAPLSEGFKTKFVKTADVVVLSFTRARNEAGREVGSATFGVRVPFLEQNLHARTVVEDFGSQGLENCYAAIGSCSLIGKPEVKVGDVIEVKYLYRDGKGGLIQPRMVRVRTDKAAYECTLAQFPAYSREVILR